MDEMMKGGLEKMETKMEVWNRGTAKWASVPGGRGTFGGFSYSGMDQLAVFVGSCQPRRPVDEALAAVETQKTRLEVGPPGGCFLPSRSSSSAPL